MMRDGLPVGRGDRPRQARDLWIVHTRTLQNIIMWFHSTKKITKGRIRETW